MANGTDVRIAHGSGQMRAQSISIQVSNRERCNGGCRFCISRTTPGVDRPESARDIKQCGMRRLHVGFGYARQLGASHAILTGKADPTQEADEYLCEVVRTAREYLPLVDMHTNGVLLHPGRPQEQLLERLTDAGLTMVTFSIASFDSGQNRALMLCKQSAADLIPHARDLGLLVRCSLVVNASGIQDVDGILEYIQVVGNLGAQMVVIREVWIPDACGAYDREVYDWNRANVVPLGSIQEEFLHIAAEHENGYGLRLRDPLPWGTPVFTVSGVFTKRDHGVNVTFARCDEATTGTVMKSIVHKPDGHGYRNWDDNGDILY